MKLNYTELDGLIKFIYSVADEILINTYEPSKYKDVILPMTVIRRLDLVLEPTKDKVLETYEKYKGQMQNLDSLLTSPVHGSGLKFYNTSPFTLKKLLNDGANIKANFENYLDGFSPNVKDIISRFKFRNEIDTLDEAHKLFSTIQKFCSPKINLSPDHLPPLSMGYVFEDLIRRFNEATNAEAGRHYTPREIIELMTHVIFLPVKENIKHGGFLIYDPCAGSGAMLTESKKYITDEAGDIRSEASIHLYGQENTPTIYAISKSDMLLKNEDPDKIVFGSTLSAYGFPDDLKFDFMLTNPPYGTSWKDDKKRLGVGEKGKILDKRFFVSKSYDAEAVTTRVNDGQLMFMLHMLSKMKDTEKGSRIASVHNGSALFTGDAGQGESEIRKHIIESDMLEAIIALPTDIFYNTGIPTFILVISNRKAKHRKGKIQLINANVDGFFTKRKKSLGSKRNELKEQHIKEITKLYLDFKETENSLIFDNEDFGYSQIVVHRPLRLAVKMDSKNIAGVRFASDNPELRKAIYTEFGDAVYSKEIKDKEAIEEFLLNYFLESDAEDEDPVEIEYASLNKKQKAIYTKVADTASWLRDKDLMKKTTDLAEKIGEDLWTDFNKFDKKFTATAKELGFKLSAKDKKDILKNISWNDALAEKVIKKTNKDGTLEYVSDTALKDFENITLKNDIQEFFDAEVLPYVPDAWWSPEETKVGYEINFNKYFYKYQEPRALSEIAKDIFAIEEVTENLLKEIVE